jgi:hypothetical protein
MRCYSVPVLAHGGSLFIGNRNESRMRLMAHDVTGHVFDANHDLAGEVFDVILPFLAGLRSPDVGSQMWGSASIAL